MIGQLTLQCARNPAASGSEHQRVLCVSMCVVHVHAGRSVACRSKLSQSMGTPLRLAGLCILDPVLMCSTAHGIDYLRSTGLCTHHALHFCSSRLAQAEPSRDLWELASRTPSLPPSLAAHARAEGACHNVTLPQKQTKNKKQKHPPSLAAHARAEGAAGLRRQRVLRECWCFLFVFIYLSILIYLIIYLFVFTFLFWASMATSST